MELSCEQPPAYVSHDPEELKLPSVPQQSIRSGPHKSDVTLPNLQTVLANLPERPDIPPTASSQQSRSHLPQPDINAHGSQSAIRPSRGSAIITPSDTASVTSLDEPGRRSTSVVSLEDPDVRLAAEALSGLGNPGEHVSSD